MLNIRVSNMPLSDLYEMPLKCRFNFNFKSIDMAFETDAMLQQTAAANGMQFSE